MNTRITIAVVAALFASALAIACGQPAPQAPPLPDVTAPTSGAHLPTAVK